MSVDKRVARVSDKQRRILQIVADHCYVDERYGQIKCCISDRLFGWTMFDSYSERDRFFKNLEKRQFIELHQGGHMAMITDSGREIIAKEPA